jgi:hypothetical protein
MKNICIETREQELLDNIFNNRWKNKYEMRWCNYHECYCLICSVCKNTTCNGVGCEECKYDFNQFNLSVYHTIWKYLSDDEKRVYDKIITIKRLMKESLDKGNEKMDFNEMFKEGELSEHDADLLVTPKPHFS